MDDLVAPPASRPATVAKPERLGANLVAGSMNVAMLWNLLSFTISQASGFVVFLVLAAKLSPEVFGVVALASLVAEFIAVDGRWACMDAIMQAKRYDQRFLNSAFVGFFAVTCLVVLAMVAGAPLMAKWSDEPLVATFMPSFALLVLPIPWLAVMDALLMRDLHFRKLTERNIAASLLGGVAGIAWTFTPYAVWALVLQRAVSLIAGGVLEFSATRWLPGLNVDWREAVSFQRRMLALWSILTLTQLMGRAFTFVFGLRYDAATVGLTRAAGRIVETVQVPIVSPLMALWFPLMSKVRGNVQAERDVFNSIVVTAGFLTFPVFLGLTVVTDDVAQLLLPERYAGVVPLMQAMCLTRLLIPIFWFNTIAMTSLEMNRISLTYSAAAVFVEVATLVGVPNVSAPVALIIAPSTTIFMGILGARILNRRLEQSNLRYYRELLPAGIASLVMVATTMALRTQLTEVPIILRLAASAACGVAVYGGFLWFFHKRWLLDRIELLWGRERHGAR